MKKLVAIMLVLICAAVFHWSYAQIRKNQDFADCNARIINPENCQQVMTSCLRHVANSSVANKKAYQQFFQDFSSVKLETFCTVSSGVGICKARYTAGCYYLQQGPQSLWPEAKQQLIQEIASLRSAAAPTFEDSTRICSFKCSAISNGQCQNPPARSAWTCG